MVSGHRGGSAALALGDEHHPFFPESSTTAANERERFGRMIGQSAPMQRVFETLSRAAARNTTVLLEGETGTGKELAARALQLLESELFGHERGSFTGAVSSRQGVFEAAAGGTVFLDEIGELALDLQPKLLRVLERREVRRIGTNNHVPVDVRLIAATNRNMRNEVDNRKFRADLFYRLAVVEVRLPPLRERTGIAETMRPLDEETEHAMASPEFLAGLASYDWPGNIRELRNFLERCAALGDFRPPQSHRTAPTVTPEATVLIGRPLREAREEWTNTFEKRYLEELLIAHGNRVSAAARAAGVDRIYFYRLLWKHGLRTREAAIRDGEVPRTPEPKAT